MPDPAKHWVSIRSAELSADIDPLGAQLSILRDGSGQDLLWDGDPSVWAGRAPLLFPIVGALAGGSYCLDSKPFPLSRHGFARGKPFDIIESNAADAMFRLTADEASFQVYPFKFELLVHFRIEAAALTVTASVRNKGDADMPASLGFHPALRWPLPFGQPRSSHFIEFAREETQPIRRLNAKGLLSPDTHPSPVSNRRLALADALFDDDVIIFDDIKSRRVSYGANQGPRIEVAFPDAHYLGVWSKPGANFICIEPWDGIADPEGFSADFRTKPGIVMVAPGAGLTLTMTISLL